MTDIVLGWHGLALLCLAAAIRKLGASTSRGGWALSGLMGSGAMSCLPPAFSANLTTCATCACTGFWSSIEKVMLRFSNMLSTARILRVPDSMSQSALPRTWALPVVEKRLTWQHSNLGSHLPSTSSLASHGASSEGQ